MALLLTSCAPNITYYQMYKTGSEGLVKRDNLLIYENDSVKIGYNLWGDGGNVGFAFYNKSSQNMYLDLDDCFFILNGVAYNYYKSRTFTTSKSTNVSTSSEISASKAVGASASSATTFYTDPSISTSKTVSAAAAISAYSATKVMTASGYSVAYAEEKTICIPPKTAKVISEYSINESIYRDCDLLRFPSKKETAIKTFDRSNSPYVFSNRIAYRIGQDQTKRYLENVFYVSEISNQYKDKVLVEDYDRFCGEEAYTKSFFFKDSEPDWFYLKYNKPSSTIWSH